MVKVSEVFTSIQGEGPFVGYKQLFLRLCSCNLHCKYCDTEFGFANAKEYSTQELLNIVDNSLDCHSISLTGGEPLLSIEFLKDFLPYCKLPVYLETNATLSKNLEKIIDFVDYIAADIKLPSCTNLQALWNEHDNFFSIASKKNLYAKMVFDDNILDSEIEEACKLCKKYDIELVLQPKMLGNQLTINSVFIQKILDKCLSLHRKVRLIPQVHKFIDVE